MSSIFFYSRFHLYGYCLLDIHTSVSPFFHRLPARGPPLENVTAAILSYIYIYIYIYICDSIYAVSHLHEGTGIPCRKLVPIQLAISQSLSPVYSLWKNDLPLSVSICKPRTGGHPSKYWPSAKLLDLGDRLVPDTYHIPNAVSPCVKYFTL